MDEAMLAAQDERGCQPLHCAVSTFSHSAPVRAAVQREANKLVEEFMLLALISEAALCPLH